MELQGKAAIVTGGGSGIGAAIARAFAREGAAVTIDYGHHSDRAEAVAAEIKQRGGRAIVVKADVARPDDVEALVSRTVSEFGRLDILVNNSGIEHPTPMLEMSDEIWDKTLAVNLKGTFLCTRAAGRYMAEHGGGSIINVSSVHEDLPMPNNAAYCAAKGGVRMFMRTIAVELAPKGIRVNNIGPGAIDTPINAATMADPEKLRTLEASIPLGKVGSAAEVAEVAVFLASDRASYVTGSTYFVDGGLMRQSGSL